MYCLFVQQKCSNLSNFMQKFLKLLRLLTACQKIVNMLDQHAQLKMLDQIKQFTKTFFKRLIFF